MSNEKKKKKEKVKYVDDGRTIADMSNVANGRKSLDGSQRSSSSAKEKWKTYWEAVKLMFLPMMVVLGILTAIFLVMYFLL